MLKFIKNIVSLFCVFNFGSKLQHDIYKSFYGIKTFFIGTADINDLLVSEMGQPADNSFIVALFRKPIGTPSFGNGPNFW